MDVPRKPGTLNAPEQPSDELTSSLHKQSSAADLMIRPVSYLTQTVHDPGVTFTEVGTPSGLTVSGCSYSVALGDYDNDGWVDLFISFVHIPDVLYRNNRDGTFVDVTGDAGIQDQEQTAGEGVTWGDFDNDGHLDLFVSNLDSPNVLYRNLGDGTFEDVTLSSGLGYEGNSLAASWADFDADGYLDLYLGVRTGLSFRGATPGVPNILYRNNGDGTFADVSASAGVDDPGDQDGGVGWADYDNDGDMDLYVSNRNPDPNVLYRNNGDGTFADVGEVAGVADTGDGEGVAWGDYDNDGDFDLFLAVQGVRVSKLYRNNGDGTFTDVAEVSGASTPFGCVGASWADYDNDGYLDLYVTCIGNPNHLFRNNGDGTFTDLAQSAGIDISRTGRGAGWADYNRDGYLDLMVSTWDFGPKFLFRNNGGDNHFLVVRVVTTDGRDAVGATVDVTIVKDGEPFKQHRQVTTASGRHSQGSLPVEFGLGDAEKATVRVKFSSGLTRTVTDITANSRIVVVEGPGLTEANRSLSLLSADLVLGQPDFYSTGANRDPAGRNAPPVGPPKANTLSIDVSRMIFDHAGSLWLTDKENNRVLRFDPPFINGMDASLVLGQPDVESYGAGPPTASSLSGPVGLAFDFGQDGVQGNADDSLWVADRDRQRLIRFDPPFHNGMEAVAVLGAPDFESIVRGPSANHFSHPRDVKIDSFGNLWVSDQEANRILMFRMPLGASGSIPGTNRSADGILGQDSFAFGGPNRGAGDEAVRNGFYDPRDMAFDAHGNLWVADNDNERVVRYDAPFEWTGLVPGAQDGADVVLGQPDFVSNDQRRGLVSDTEWGLAQPSGVAVDPDGNVWVVDQFTRLLRFDAPIDETGLVPGAADRADAVIGQPNFWFVGTNRGFRGPRPDGLSRAAGIAVDPEGNIWVADHDHDRVLRFPVARLSD